MFALQGFENAQIGVTDDKLVYDYDSYHVPHPLVLTQRVFGLPVFSKAPFGDNFLVIKRVRGGPGFGS